MPLGSPLSHQLDRCTVPGSGGEASVARDEWGFARLGEPT
jgi:hypothetical protein